VAASTSCCPYHPVPALATGKTYPPSHINTILPARHRNNNTS
jgi:hypothetical protein